MIYRVKILVKKLMKKFFSGKMKKGLYFSEKV
nr:MAG TPA: hypothetical protein [Caudoviricetes sp.]